MEITKIPWKSREIFFPALRKYRSQAAQVREAAHIGVAARGRVDAVEGVLPTVLLRPVQGLAQRVGVELARIPGRQCFKMSIFLFIIMLTLFGAEHNG